MPNTEQADHPEPRRHHGHREAHDRTATDLTRRLKSVEGHVRGIQKMVAEDVYCIDLLKQIKAVRAALDKIGAIALETHLETCVTDGLASGEPAERERVIGEILDVFAQSSKR